MAQSEALRKLQELVKAKQLAAKLASDAIKLNIPPEGMEPAKLPESFRPAPLAQAVIAYNEAQNRFIKYVVEGHSVALTGPAGSGKTTATKGAVLSLIQSGRVGQLSVPGHKWLVNGSPGIVCTSFTNKAVQNLKKVMPADLRGNCMTIHKLLEYAPVFSEVYDPATSKYRTTMRFEPSWHEGRKLSTSLQVLIIDEAPMVPVELWNRLFEALPLSHNLQIILIGDIQQLPPVFGKSIFIHALQAGVHKVELTEIYRQALESPIISLAHAVLKGTIIPAPKLEEWNIDKLESGNGKVTIKPWKKPLSAEAAMAVMGKFLPELISAGEYDPLEDTILCPYNKAFGTIELNKIVASYLARHKNPEGHHVFEVIAGINKKYFRVGDKVLFNKTEHTIREIKKNPKYFGKPCKASSPTLDYWGVEQDATNSAALAALLAGEELAAEHNSTIDAILSSFEVDSEEKGLGTQAASHIIVVWSEELEQEEELSSAGEVGQLDLGYAITVHKSQGSEYRRVFFITHQSQSNMLFRELVYTAITRAREELYIVCPPSLFVAGVTSQRLPGKNLDEKIEAFERYAQLNRGRTSEDEEPQGLFLFAPKET